MDEEVPYVYRPRTYGGFYIRNPFDEIREQQEKLKTMNEQYWKAYLVEFTSKEDGSTFLKFGACNDRNAEDRFKHEPEQYADYDIKVLASISPNRNNINYMKMGKVEQYFLKKYPRNTKYFKKNFSGISETYQPADRAERNHIIREFYELQKKVYSGEALV